MGLRIRDATAADYGAFRRLFPELEVDDPIPPVSTWKRDVMPTMLTVDTDGGEAIGYAFFRILDTVGYVHNIVVAPDARGRGVGRALMNAMAERFRAAGVPEWCLNVKPDNAAAIRLYERCGMTARYDSTVLQIEWSQVGALPAGASGVQSRRVSERDVPEIEAALGLLPGQILRRPLDAPGRVPVQLRDAADRVVGYADFAQSFPGAFPFRLAESELAGALLRALLPHALPEHEHIQLVLEDDAGAVSLLLAAGASVRFEVRHFRGPLPGVAE